MMNHISPTKNTKLRNGQKWTLEHIRLRAGASNEEASPVDRSHTSIALYPDQINIVICNQNQYTMNGLTICTKHVR